MASYFQVTEKADLELLPETMREGKELSGIAVQAERDVIAQFTERFTAVSHYEGLLNTDIYLNMDLSLVIFLRGYTTDSGDADVDVDMKAALKDTIAEVIKWRMRKRLVNPLLDSQSDDSGKSVTYRSETREPFPPNWDWRMTPFDARPVTWSL